MLAARGHAFPLQRPDDHGAEAGHFARSFSQRAIANHRILRVGVDVEHRSVIERDSGGGELARQRAPEPFGERFGPRSAQHRHRRPFGERLLQPGDAAALLIDAHPGRRAAPERFDLGGELHDLFGRLDVAAEEDAAPEVELARQRAELRRERRARKAADEKLADVACG